MSMRVIDAGYKITRPTNDIGRYKMILHNKRTRALNRYFFFVNNDKYIVIINLST